MDNFIIPNWHPMLVHFTVALITVSAIFFVLSKTVKSKADTFESVAKWTLWAGAGITILTVLAGFGAYNSVDHDDVAHKVMKVHRTWALLTGVAILLLTLWSLRAKAVSSAMVAASLVIAGLVGVTGYLGAELVYRHGLGVMRLPDTTGEGHAHEGGGGHDHGTPTSEEALHDHAERDEHSEEKTEEASHEHADGEGHDEVAIKPEEKSHEHAEVGGHDHGDSDGDAGFSAIDPGAVSDALFSALQSGDAASVSMLLADDVLILEGEYAQTSKAEYMAGHMKSDMAFLPNISSETISRETGQAGDVAWVITHSKKFGSYKGKTIDGFSREFLQLKRIEDSWKIVLIQWGEK